MTDHTLLVLCIPESNLRWRCEGTHYADGDCYISFSSFRVVKATKRGEWIDIYGEHKFALNDAMKRCAYPTKKEALESYIRRKAKQTRILSVQLGAAEALYKAATAKMVRNDFSNEIEPLMTFDSIFGVVS